MPALQGKHRETRERADHDDGTGRDHHGGGDGASKVLEKKMCFDARGSKGARVSDGETIHFKRKRNKTVSDVCLSDDVKKHVLLRGCLLTRETRFRST